jgi:hypothetical protein
MRTLFVLGLCFAAQWFMGCDRGSPATVAVPPGNPAILMPSQVAPDQEPVQSEAPAKIVYVTLDPPVPTVGDPLTDIRKVGVSVLVDGDDYIKNTVFGENSRLNSISRDTRLKLRRAGLIVTENPAPNDPILLVSFTAVRDPTDVVSYARNVVLSGPATCPNGKLSIVQLWSGASTGYIGRARYDELRHIASDGVDGFLSDWLAANPSGHSAPTQDEFEKIAASIPSPARVMQDLAVQFPNAAEGKMVVDNWGRTFRFGKGAWKPL